MNRAAQLSAAQRQYDNASPDELDDAAWEAREEYIEDNAPAAAKALLGSPDFSLDPLTSLSNDEKDCVLESVGMFFERVQNTDDDRKIADAAVRLWKYLIPYIEPAALEQAKQDVAEAYDREQNDMPRSAAEYARELAA